MPSSRTRLVVMATALALVAALGIVWLVRSATTDGGSAAGDGATSPATPPDGTASGAPTGTTTSAASGGVTPDGDRTRTSGRRSIRVNGLRLDGSDDGDGCMTVMNDTATTLTVEGISFTAAGIRARPAVRSDNAAHCGGGPRCDGARLPPDGDCRAGAVLAPNAPPGEYEITPLAQISYVCDNAERSPCDKVPDWGGPPPTPRDPVLVRGVDSRAPELNVTVEETGPPPSPSSPYSPVSPHTTGTPETPPSPNPPPPPADPSAPARE
ncbi:hypothetical protein [Streptomyces sp. G45]|uniref:hypothetical protein n=1 Tax=Streptomyces sp. G45 TaxID=3406627 RepID=UPI003C27700E